MALLSTFVFFSFGRQLNLPVSWLFLRSQANLQARGWLWMATAREAVGKLEEERAFATIAGIPGLRVYRNVYIPTGDGRTAEIDLLILSAKGVFPVEVKGFGGSITGSRTRYEWTRRHRKKGRGKEAVTRFFNPIRQSNAHLAAASRYLGVPIGSCCGLVVFSDRATLEKVPSNTGSCIVLQTRELNAVMRRMLAKRKDRFSPAELRRLEARLDAIPKASDSMKRLHVVQARRAEQMRKAEQARRRECRRKG